MCLFKLEFSSFLAIYPGVGLLDHMVTLFLVFKVNFILFSKVGLVAESCLTLVTPWTVAHQAPLPIGFSRQEY